MSVPEDMMFEDDPEQQQKEARDKLLNAIDAAEESSYGSEVDSKLSTERGYAIDFYLGKNVEPAPTGRSQVTDRTVFETIQWILPSLLRIYAGGGNVVEFEPLGPDDEESAEQESDYLNYIVTQKNRWFDTLLAWFQDALTTKNAYCLAFIDEKLNTETERYERQSEEQISLLTREDGVEVVQFSSYPDEESDPVPMTNQMGQPVVDDYGMLVMQPVMLYDIVIRRVKPERKVSFRVLPPERCRISEHTPTHTLDECPYFEYWDYKTVSEIRAMGFDVDDDEASDIDIDTDEDDSRDRFGENILEEDNPTDPSMRRMKFRTIWIRHDTDGDGIAEMQRVVLLGRNILLLEEESRIPVSSIVPYILTHRHIGISLADIVVDIQRIMTAILRQGLDNLYQTNNQRWAHTDKVNLDELLSSVPGGAVEVDGNPNENLMPLVPPFVFPQAVQGLEYMDRVKEKRTGLNKTFSGVDESQMQQTATGIAQLASMASQRVEMIARMFAPGIEYLFSVAHELILKHGHKAETVKLRGQWTNIDPRTWKTGRDLKVSVGFGAGNKDALVARAMNLWQMQLQAGQMGARIVDENNLYETALQITKASDFQTPEKYWTDPNQLGPKQNPPTQDQIYQQVEMAKIASNERIKMAELGIKPHQAAQEHNFDVELEHVKGDEDVRLELVKQRE